MKHYLIIALLFLMSSPTLLSQDSNKNNKAERPITFTSLEMEEFKHRLINELKRIPSWNKQPNLYDKVHFEDSDIQVYGYKEFPILQIDFRFTFASLRKKGYNYQAQYIYTDQPKLNKTKVVIDSGSTKYIKQ